MADRYQRHGGQCVCHYSGSAPRLMTNIAQPAQWLMTSSSMKSETSRRMALRFGERLYWYMNLRDSTWHDRPAERPDTTAWMGGSSGGWRTEQRRDARGRGGEDSRQFHLLLSKAGGKNRGEATSGDRGGWVVCVCVLVCVPYPRKTMPVDCSSRGNRSSEVHRETAQAAQ